MPIYVLFLLQAQRYEEDLEARLTRLGLAAPIFLQTQLEDTRQIIQVTQQAVDGIIPAHIWDTAVQQFLLWPTQPLDYVLELGLSAYFDMLAQEPVLTSVDWQHLLHSDPWRARRRYCHQAWLASYHPAHYLQPSVVAFQACAQRQPNRFRQQAVQQVQAWLRASERADAEYSLQGLWSQISSVPYPDATPYMRFAGPSALLQHVRDDCDHLVAAREILQSQATSPYTWRAKLRTFLRPGKSHPTSCDQDDAQPLYDLLAIAWEEAQLADPPRGIGTAAKQSSLAPYPDEGIWQHWLSTDETVARQRFAQLLLVEVHIGPFAPFHLGESIAAFRSLGLT